AWASPRLAPNPIKAREARGDVFFMVCVRPWLVLLARRAARWWSGTGGRLAPAPAASGGTGAATAFLHLVGLNHLRAQGVVGIGQIHPPLGIHTVHLTCFGT